MSSSQALTVQTDTIIRTTTAQYYVNQAVKGGVERQQVQSGSVTFIQRFGGDVNTCMIEKLVRNTLCLEQYPLCSFKEGVYARYSAST